MEDNMMSQEKWESMPKGEQTTFFLVNALKMLNDEQRKILTRSLLERLSPEDYHQAVYESAVGREDVKSGESITFDKDRGIECLVLNNKKITGVELIGIIDGAFEEERNSEKVEKLKITPNNRGGFDVNFDIYDDHHDAVLSNTMLIKSTGQTDIRLHEAYEGGGIEDIIATNLLKLAYSN